MLRAVLAVVLAAALVGTATAALDVAGHRQSDRLVDAEVERLVAAARDLQASEAAVAVGRPGARRHVTVHLPGKDLTTACVAYLAIGGDPLADDRGDTTAATVAWKIVGGTRRNRRIAGLSVEHAVDGRPTARPLVLREPGVHHLVLTLVRRNGRRVVLVSRRADA
ncbi:MAG: hypothetical protein ABEJ31_07960 [Haloarculaceae archaeon]